MLDTFHDLTVVPGFDCNGCGACCLHMASPPLSAEEIEALPAELKAEMKAWLDSDESWDDSYRPCFWFDADTKTCRHYEHRPGICQDFEVGNPACLGMRSDRGLCTAQGKKPLEV